MAERKPRIGPDEAVYQFITDRWRREALRRLAFKNRSTMRDELETMIDAHLTAAGIPLGDQ